MVWVTATTTRNVHSYIGLLSEAVNMKSGRLRTVALLGAATCVLQPAATFVLRLRPGAFDLSVGTTSPQIADIRHPRHANFMRLTHDEGDLGGVDTRISGWRSTKPEDVGDQDLEGVDSLGPMKDEHGLEPACGDVVEYPLAEAVKRDAEDGREKGVGVIVTINKLRNDAWKLPTELLDRAEIQALCPDTDAEVDMGADGGKGVDGSVWMADELEACAFAQLGDLRVLKAKFNGGLDKWRRWTIEDDLSEGCGARDPDWEYDML